MSRWNEGSLEEHKLPRGEERRIISWPGLAGEPDEVLKRSKNICWIRLTSKSAGLHPGLRLPTEVMIKHENMQSTVFLCLDEVGEGLIHQKSSRETKTILEEYCAFFNKWVVSCNKRGCQGKTQRCLWELLFKKNMSVVFRHKIDLGKWKVEQMAVD